MSQKDNPIKTELNSLYNTGKLDEYLKEVSEQKLAYLQLSLLMESWRTDYDAILCDKVSKERRRRFLNKFLDEDTTDFINEEYEDLAKTVPLEGFKKSYLYCAERDIDYTHLVKWCPTMMHIELVHKIYEQLKFYGFTEEDIYRVITYSSEKLVYFTQMVERFNHPNQKDLESDVDFEKFVLKTSRKLQESKSGTESYKKMIEQEITKNEDVIRKLQ